jgi:predicted nucleic acid-binding protein
MTLVDASAWVEFLRRRGDPQAKEAVAGLLEDGLTAYTCPILFELLSGARPEEEADLQQALDFSRHILFESDDWREAALLERSLRAKGLKVPRNDLFVATVAIRTGLSLVCRDAHFTAIQKALDGKLMVDQI